MRFGSVGGEVDQAPTPLVEMLGLGASANGRSSLTSLATGVSGIKEDVAAKAPEVAAPPSWKSESTSCFDHLCPSAARPPSFQYDPMTAFLEYADKSVERQYVDVWCYRARRLNLSALCMTFAVLSLMQLINDPFGKEPSVTYLSVTVAAALAILGLISALHSFLLPPPADCQSLLRLKASDPAYVAASTSRRGYELALLSTCVCLAVWCTGTYLYLDSCVDAESPDLVCRERMPAFPVLSSSVLAVATPIRCRMALPFILVLFNAATFLPALFMSAHNLEPAELTEVKFAVSMMISLGFAAAHVNKDRVERASFEAALLALWRMEAISSVRQSVEKNLEGSLPLSAAQRLSRGIPVCDASPAATIGVVALTFSSKPVLPRVAHRRFNDVVTAFDRVVRRNLCDRVKTSGDVYVLSAGLQPSLGPRDACVAVCCACLEILRLASQTFCIDGDEIFSPNAPLRICVDSGRAVGGLVGVQTMGYVVFGPAVNHALEAVYLCPSNCVVATEAARALYGETFEDSQVMLSAPVRGVAGVYKIFPAVLSAAARFEDNTMAVLTSSSPEPTFAASIPHTLRFQALRSATSASRSGENLYIPVAGTGPMSDNRDTIPNPLGLHPGGPFLPALHSHGTVESIATIEASFVAAVRTHQGWSLTYACPWLETALREFEKPFVRRTGMILCALHVTILSSTMILYYVDPNGGAKGMVDGVSICIASIIGNAAVLAALAVEGAWSRIGAARSLSAAYNLAAMGLWVAALLTLPHSIPNGGFNYAGGLLTHLAIQGGMAWLPNTPVAMFAAAANFCMCWLVGKQNLYAALGTSLTILVFANFCCVQAEKALRSHFETVYLSNAQLRACEDELAMQRKMYEMLLPPFLAKALIERKLRPGATGKVVSEYDELCVIAVRIDNLASTVGALLANPQAALGVPDAVCLRLEELLALSVAACCPADLATLQMELLCKISMLGDVALIAGPFAHGVARDSTTRIAVATALHFLGVIAAEGPFQLDLPKELSLVETRPSATAVATFHSSSLLLLDSECLSLLLVGPAAQLAHALVVAAPAGYVGCTRAFKAAAVVAVPTCCDDVGILEPWRLRGLGSIEMAKVRAITPQQQNAPPPSFYVK